MVELLQRKFAQTFATWTFTRPRRDEFGVVEAIRAHLYRWQADRAATDGTVKVKTKKWLDAYQREVGCKVKRSGPFVRAMKRGEGLQWAVFVEPHESGNLHAHGLLWWGTFQGELSRRRAWELWRDPAPFGMGQGQFARFEPPKDTNAVVGYCAKYCLKADASLYLSDNLTLPGDLWFSTTLSTPRGTTARDTSAGRGSSVRPILDPPCALT